MDVEGEKSYPKDKNNIFSKTTEEKFLIYENRCPIRYNTKNIK